MFKKAQDIVTTLSAVKILSSKDESGMDEGGMDIRGTGVSGLN